jgi:hypothetical protein
MAKEESLFLTMAKEYQKYIKHNISDFLANAPLYEPFKAVENYIRQSYAYTDPFEFKGITFTYYCEQEKDLKTFELQLTNATSEYFGHMRGDQIAQELFDSDGRLDFEHHFIGQCQSCKKFHVDYLLHVYTDKPIPNDQSNTVKFDKKTNEQRPADEYAEDRAGIFIEKIGGPKVKPSIPKMFEKYLDREARNWLYKAKVCMKDGLGIGGFAYFRRIIEKELLSIVNDIATLPDADPELKSLIEKHQKSNKPHLIYDELFPYLPKSLQMLDDNPIKLLYSQTSEGLHTLTEADCLARAKQIELVLEFVIQKINEERSMVQNVREALKQLRNG